MTKEEIKNKAKEITAQLKGLNFSDAQEILRTAINEAEKCALIN